MTPTRPRLSLTARILSLPRLLVRRSDLLSRDQPRQQEAVDRLGIWRGKLAVPGRRRTKKAMAISRRLSASTPLTAAAGPSLSDECGGAVETLRAKPRLTCSQEEHAPG